jgi:diguanylate cyclase (GGDEF)-like protein
MKMSNRELTNLILIVLISIFFSIFSVSIHFIHKIFVYFYPYTKLPVVEFIFSVISFWLTCLIWTTYRYWRKAEENQEKLRDPSLRDQLTNLYNRQGFFTLAEHQVRMAKQMKKEIMLLYMDVNCLKWINDTFGHLSGDQALIDTANILEGTFRESDIIARIGGDEFVALLFGVSQDNAGVLTKRLEKHIEDFNVKGTHIYKMELSTSMVFYDYRCHLSIEELLQQADGLMYGEKQKKSERLPEMQFDMEEA